MSAADVVLGGPVHVEAIAPQGGVLDRFELAHGADPAAELTARGWCPTGPVRARREGEPVVLTVPVTASGADRAAPVAAPPPRRRPADLVIAPGQEPVRVQRVAAYGVVVCDLGLLATQYSDLVATPDAWGLPGGGLDPGEDPLAALTRECHEETGQEICRATLDHVVADHWIGHSPRRALEDFHAVRFIYRADCPEPTAPVVHDVGGTTSAARWVPLDAVAELAWATFSRRALARAGLIDGGAQLR